LSPDMPCLQLERLGCMRESRSESDELRFTASFARSGTRIRSSCSSTQRSCRLTRDGERRPSLCCSVPSASIAATRASYHILANVLWDERRLEEALELYRLAACLNDKDEAFAESYFRAAQWFKRTEEALAFLRRRFERFGRKSIGPACTLVRAYLRWNRTAEAVAVLEEAMRLRPDDGELQLFAADAYLSCSNGNVPLASSLIERAKGAARPAYWLRTAAPRLASREGKAAEALQLWQRLLQSQPLADDAHRAVAELLAATEGKAAALAHLAAVVDRFPYHLPLHGLRLEWVRGEPPEAANRLSVSPSPSALITRGSAANWPSFWPNNSDRPKPGRRRTPPGASSRPVRPITTSVPACCEMEARSTRQNPAFAKPSAFGRL